MIGSFRRRFVATTMVLVGVVSLVTFIGIAAMSYQQTKGVLDDALEYAAESRQTDTFTLPDLGDDSSQEIGARESGVPVYLVSVYTDFASTSYSIVVNQSSTALMSDEITETAVREVLERVEGGRELGSLAGEGLYYYSVTTSYGYRIAFADSSLVMDDFMDRIWMLVGLWVLLMLGMLAVTVYLSRIVARPVERAWADQQRFIADASHELKTPLTVILANASILSSDKDKTVAEQEVWVEGITEEAERMRHLTESMLTLAQEDAGVDGKRDMAPLDFSALVEGQILVFDAVAFERSLTIAGDIDEGVRVVGDEARLVNLVKTLLENACKYARAGSEIDVGLRAVRGDAQLTVSNDGETIPADELPHLFDRFYRSDRARSSGETGETASFGLGLSIAKSTAQAHGGSISAASADSRTTFTVKIPLAK